MIDKAELRQMSQSERRELAALLAELDDPDPPPGRVRLDPYRVDPVLRRERRLALLVSAACCVILAGWIVVLVATLPHHFDAHHWRALWVNFDVLLLAAFAATAWAIWRQRQVLIMLLAIIGTMLACDAWFDVGTSLATNGIWISLLSALFAELPLAFLAFAGARRLLRATVAASILAGARIGPDIPDWARAGNWGRSCAGQSLSSAPLAGAGLHEALPRSRKERKSVATVKLARSARCARCRTGSSCAPHLSQRRRAPRHKGSADPEGRTVDASHFIEYRPLMFSIAYRMTGSVSDAEDIVQEAFLRAGRAGEDAGDVESPRAYLATVTTRLAIDHLRSARVRRESYVGTWLPEPLIEHGEPGPAELAEIADSLSMAFLVLLESLTPPERAVFLLREVFGYGYPEIAGITGKTEAACRQTFARARRRIDEGRPRFETSRAEGEELTSLFLAAAAGGDMTSLLQRLAPDVMFYGDSGGHGEISFIEPVAGRERVAEVVRAQVERTLRLGASLHPIQVNGQPGVLARDSDGALVAVIAFDILDGQVQAIRAIANPDKLRHIGPVSRTWHLRWSDPENSEQEN